jgi:hypothetical protein
MKPVALRPITGRAMTQEESAQPAAGSSWTVAVAALAAAVLLVIGATLVQGIWTDRWSDRNASETLTRAARILERSFPNQFGDWEFERELESDPKELDRAGAVGHVSKLYRNVRTKARVSAFVVCATPHDASGHTPDRCYPGAGFEIAESEHRQAVPLQDGRNAETFTATFRKQGQTIRVFWTYGVGGQWVAPQIARIELAGTDSVYKLYAIIDETRISGAQATLECIDFLAALLPEIDKGVADATVHPAPMEKPGETPPEGAAAAAAAVRITPRSRVVARR